MISSLPEPMEFSTVMGHQVQMGPQELKDRIKNVALLISNIIAVQVAMAAMASRGVMDLMVEME
jgi:hypothetical protein